jgi:large subunit ribosomal protein L3
MDGLIGTKQGMTQVHDGQGRYVAVTVLEVGPCIVVQRKTKSQDGYDAVQVGFGEQKEHRVSRPLLARFKKAGVTPKRWLREFRLGEGEDLKAGDSVGVKIFEGVSHVDVSGAGTGRGFQGVVRRHHMRGGKMTHGGHSKRRVGSIGQRATPGNVERGKRMPGHMGNRRVTQQSLAVVAVRGEENVLLVRGAVPGPTGSLVIVRKALKRAEKKAGQKA